MKTINELVNLTQKPSNSTEIETAQQLAVFNNGQERQVIEIDGETFVNIRSKIPATDNEIANALTILSNAFPTMPQPFWDNIVACVKRNKMSVKQLSDRVIRIIELHTYRTFTIAEFVKGVKHKCLTYNQMLATMGDNGTRDFESVKIGEKVMWIDKREI
jgi:hypothetical protein